LKVSSAFLEMVEEGNFVVLDTETTGLAYLQRLAR